MSEQATSLPTSGSESRPSRSARLMGRPEAGTGRHSSGAPAPGAWPVWPFPVHQALCWLAARGGGVPCSFRLKLKRRWVCGKVTPGMRQRRLRVLGGRPGPRVAAGGVVSRCRPQVALFPPPSHGGFR